jgi:hypothetical protein
MNTTHIDTTLDHYRTAFNAAEDVLATLPTDQHMPFPLLFASMQSKLISFDLEQLARMQQPIREYLHSHPYWRVANGHNGGVVHKELFEARQAKKTRKADIRTEVLTKLTTQLVGQ